MDSNYREVTTEILGQLREIAGEKNILTEELELQNYSHDEAPLLKHFSPEVVVKPPDAGAVSQILKLASLNHIPVTPRGAGTGLAGGVVPSHHGIVLSLENMNKIIEIDRENLVAVVEAGVTLTRLREEVENNGLYYPLYPGELTATLGGNVSTNAGGMNAVKYGVTRQHVLGLEAILADGSIITCGGKYVKSASGYDLTQLITGSEGTLAVITKLILRLSAKMPVREVLYAPFNNLQSAINAVPEILQMKKYPIGLEFIEKDIIDILEKYTGIQMPYHDHMAFLMLIMEDETQDEILDYFSKVEEICKKHGAVETFIPGSERAKRRLIEAREKFYPALKKYAPMEEIDIVVPRSEIARFVSRVKEISRESGIPVIAYGHAGDGNVHLHPICTGMSEKEWNERLEVLTAKIYRAGISFGGAVSGEHGIGLAKKSYLLMQLGKEKINLLKRIKQAFDPCNILNPGKIFDV